MSRWSEVSVDAPCEACGKPNWCSRTCSAMVCRRVGDHPKLGKGTLKVDEAGAEYWWWPYQTGTDQPRLGLPDPTVHQTHLESRADPDTLHCVYSALLIELKLSEQHQRELIGRGLTSSQVSRFRDHLSYRSLESKGRPEIAAKLIAAGFEPNFPRVPGFVIKTNQRGQRYWTLTGSSGMIVPVRDVRGRIVALKIRRDDPRQGKYRWMTSRRQRDGSVSGVGPGAPIHVPLHHGHCHTIRVTEGPIKADVATQLTGVLTIALPGVTTWRRAGGVAESLGAKRITIALDTDAVHNVSVARAIQGLSTELPLKGLHVHAERWDEADGKGIDDLVLAGKSPEVIEGPELRRWVNEIVALAGKATDDQVQNRYRVEVLPDEFHTIAETMKGLSTDDTLFQRGGLLVTLTRLPSDDLEDGISRIRQTPKLTRAKPLFIRELITLKLFLFKSERTQDGVLERQVSPPDWLYHSIADRGQWSHIKHISGFTEVPLLRADGTILTNPGYDPASQMVYLCDGDPPEISDSPTRANAVAARDHLLDIFADFPFATESDRAAMLSALITLFCRNAIRGCVPLFLIESAEAGTGKGLATDVIGIIATGREMPKMVNFRTPEETRKAITSCLMAGDSTIVLDNVQGQLGNSVIDKALTDTMWQDRILGGNDMGSWPMRLVFFATGNNLTIGSDTFRRIVRIRMEADCEKPAERRTFKYVRLKQHVRENRTRYVIDVLTILRAFVVAGRPPADLPGFGSFEEWSDFVRQALVWIGMADPVASAKTFAVEADPERTAFREMIELWEVVDPRRDGLTTAELVNRLEAGSAEQHLRLRNALFDLGCTKEGQLDARAMGYQFRKYVGRVVGRFRFAHAGTTGGTKKWTVQAVADRWCDGGDEGDQLTPRGNLDHSISSEDKVENPPADEFITPITPITPRSAVCHYESLSDEDRGGDSNRGQRRATNLRSRQNSNRD